MKEGVFQNGTVVQDGEVGVVGADAQLVAGDAEVPALVAARHVAAHEHHCVGQAEALVPLLLLLFGVGRRFRRVAEHLLDALLLRGRHLDQLARVAAAQAPAPVVLAAQPVPDYVRLQVGQQRAQEARLAPHHHRRVLRVLGVDNRPHGQSL